MSSFRLGPVTLASAWEPLLHPRVRALCFPALPEIDCSQCRMVRDRLYAERTKCCTYIPDLPSFLVGEILEEGHAPGAPETVPGWVEEGRGDPLMLYAPPALTRKHLEALERGPEHARPCPLLDAAGGCSIYEHRPYLCVGYHCAYPNPGAYAFWNCLSSLLALHTAVTAQYLVEALGIDRNRLAAQWRELADPGAAWTVDHRLEAGHAARLWEGQSPAAHYRAAYRYLLEHRDTVREEVDRFRRAQLLRILADDGTPSEERVRAIHAQATEPAPLAPPLEAHQAFVEGIVVFGRHRWTIPEHEGFLLWYHQAVYGSSPETA